MSKGPQGQKRPAGRVSAVVMVAKIATGEIDEELREPSAKVQSGKAGVAARAKKTGEQRSATAKKAAGSRWNSRS